MTHEEMWKAYVSRSGTKDAVYEAWCYGGGAADELLALTLSGAKTATASAYDVYLHDDSEVPKPGCYSVILDSKGEAGCIIKTVAVAVVPFNLVTKEHAAKEGEGDLSLAYWRRVHKKCFTADLAEIGKPFDEEMPVVCEEFEVVYRV